VQDNDDARQAELVAAAEALVSWIHARRATWPDSPTEAATDAEARPLFAPSHKTSRAAATPSVSPNTQTPSGPAPNVPAPNVPTPTAPSMLDLSTEHILATTAPAFDSAPFAARSPEASRVIDDVDDVDEVETSTTSRTAPLGAALSAVQWLRDRFNPRQLMYTAAAGVLLVGGWLSQPYWPTLTSDRAASPAPSAERAAPNPAPAPAPARKTGQLTARSDPSGARVIVDGTPRGVTPLTIDDLSLGRHAVVIQTDEGSVRRTVTITADRPAVVNEAVFAGFLKIFAPFDLRITDGKRAIRLDDQNQVLLPPGPYDLQLSNDELGYRETRRVEVNPGQTTTVSIVPSPSTVTVTANAESVVLIDGQPAGATPLVNHPIPLGTRDIVVRSGSGAERRFTRRVTVAPVQIEVDFSRP
jgi:hypothetical protein